MFGECKFVNFFTDMSLAEAFAKSKNTDRLVVDHDRNVYFILIKEKESILNDQGDALEKKTSCFPILVIDPVQARSLSSATYRYDYNGEQTCNHQFEKCQDVQNRSADEISSVILKCIKCDHVQFSN